MGAQSNRHLIALLPLVAAVTLLVAVLPVALVWWLRAAGVIDSFWVGAAVSVTLAFGAWYAGGALWKTRSGSRDIMFSELLLWGWAQRWRNDRRLNAAADVLGLNSGTPRALPADGLTNEQKVELLAQLTTSLEASDPYTHGHSRRVARHATNIARRMGLESERVAKIRAAAAMHDVGKLETPTAVLHKEGKLTDEEFAIIKRHPVDGALMVATLEDDELTALVRHHHERIDGRGYPDGLVGSQIPLGARIIAVADTFDAITSTRAYRRAHAHKKALDILTAEAGSQLDADAVRAFCACYSGRRPLAVWTMVSNGAPRLASWFGGGLGGAGAGSLASVAATVAAIAGGTSLGPTLDQAPAADDRDVATVAASAPTDRKRARPARDRGAARAARGQRARRSRGESPRADRVAGSRPSAPAPAPPYAPPDDYVSAPAPAPVPAAAPPPATGSPRGIGRNGRERGNGHGRGKNKETGGRRNGLGSPKDRGKRRGHERGRGEGGEPGGGHGNGLEQGGGQGPSGGNGNGPDSPSRGGGPSNGKDPGNGQPPLTDPATGLPLEEVGRGPAQPPAHAGPPPT